MILKIRSLIIVSLLVMLLPEVGSGILSKPDGAPLSNLNLLNPLSPVAHEDYYAPYYPDKSKMDYKKPNLFIGGILQNSPNSDLTDQKWKTFADNNGAIFVPTYYSVFPTELLAVNDAAKSTETDPHKTAENGLIRDELNGKTYGTIIGYSGGTTTVVTAMAEQGVKADTLILISPMMGGSLMTGETFDWKGEFEQKIQKILTLNPGIKIKVIQSTDDKLPLGDPLGDGSIAAGFQYRIHENDPNPPSWRNEIEVNNIILGNVPNGHKEMFDTYAMQNIRNGVYVDPQGQSIANPQPIFQKSPQDQITSAIANENSNLGLGLSKLKKIPPKTVLTTPTQITKSEESPQDQITSAIANENSNLGLGLSKLKKIPPKTVLKTHTQINKSAVTLTLYVRDGSASGPIIPGAQVTGQDSSGNSFQQTTDSNGYVTITGDPGTWSFSASADGYTTKPWDQEITEDCTKHAFLQEKQQQENVAPIVQDSESSVVGKWKAHEDTTENSEKPTFIAKYKYY